MVAFRAFLRRIAPFAVVALLFALALPAGLPGQEAAAPCSAPEYRQFDFWLGEWEVTNPSGEIVGKNTITSTIGGCAVHERWEGAKGGTGESVNAYDRLTNTWHQTWVGDRGLVLRLEGVLRDGSMVLEGETARPDGTSLQRITWTPAADGSVRQFWESSADDGQTWTVSFDGTYREIESP